MLRTRSLAVVGLAVHLSAPSLFSTQRTISVQTHRFVAGVEWIKITGNPNRTGDDAADAAAAAQQAASIKAKNSKAAKLAAMEEQQLAKEIIEAKKQELKEQQQQQQQQQPSDDGTTLTTSCSSSTSSTKVFSVSKTPEITVRGELDDEMDAPACPVRRTDYTFQEALRSELRRLGVADFFIRKMRRRLVLPHVLYCPTDPATALFMARYFRRDNFSDASETEILARFEQEVMALHRQHRRPSKINHHLQRLRYHMNLASKSDDETKHHHHNAATTVKQETQQSSSNSSSNVWTPRQANEGGNSKGDNKNGRSTFRRKLHTSNSNATSPLSPDTIENLTRRVTIIVQPQRIITISRYNVPFIEELSAHFDYQHAFEPPVHLLCDIYSGCIKTFVTAAREEMQFVDRLETLFFNTNPKYAQQTHYRSFLLSASRISRRASVATMVVPQSVIAFEDLCKAIDSSELRKVKNAVIEAKKAEALHSDVLNDTRSLLVLFFNTQQEQLEKLTRLLTTFSSLFIPCSFVASLFAMDLEILKPIYSSEFGFSLAMCALAFTAMATLRWISMSGLLTPKGC